MTTLLIVLPIAAAVLVGMLPLGRRAAEGLALLAALAELALWVVALLRFDTGLGGPQFGQDDVWVASFPFAPVHWHVGMTGLSLFMVGLAAVGIFSAVSAASWAGRERPRAYLALLLGLEAALVLLFTARDLVLFYVGWESMMIPLYVLLAVWGSERRRAATYQFFIYTLIGSLLMLVAIAAVGVTAGTYQLGEIPPSATAWMFFFFAAAFCIKAPLFPLHGWLPAAYRESTPEVAALLSGVVSKAGAYGLITFARPLFPTVADDYQWLILGLALAGLLYGSIIAFRQPDARGVVAYSSLAQMNLVVIGIFVFNGNGYAGATFQMVNHGIVSLAAFLLIGLVELRSGTGQFSLLGGLSNRRPVLSTVFLIAALWALAVPGSSMFISELYVLLGAFQRDAVFGGVAACTVVLAAMYMLRWYSALAHQSDGERVGEETPDLRPGELGIAVPLVLILLAMSAWPFGVMERLGP